jgi:hypothetical protein
MMEPRLQQQLAGLERKLRQTQFLRELTFCWLSAAAIGVLFLLLQGLTGWSSHVQWMLPLLGAGVAGAMIWRRHRHLDADFRALVAAIEREHPELRHLLSAAAEQEPDADLGGFRFLQLRVVEAVLTHPQRALWGRSLEKKFASARRANVAALAATLIVLLLVGYSSGRAHPLLGALLATEITVSPGDTQVERGTSLVISARFGGRPPAEATLVVASSSGKTQRISLERHLADPVFGASLGDVSEEGIYHVEYRGGKTRDYKITVFDYPALLRADALLAYPEYTGLTNKTIPDTRRISAVEGTRLTYTLQLNKPVTSARLLGGGQSLDLVLNSNAVALLSDLPLTNSLKLSLALEDAQGRSNKFPTEFVIQVLPNRRPELKLVFPRGDPRVSRLEELQLQAEASGEFGLLKYGVGYALAGQDPQLIELGQSAPRNEKRQFNYLLPLENLGVQADQVISYFVWADDPGPDGGTRRTFSDMFFAEVRPFEELFRAQPPGSGGDDSDQQGGGGGGGGQDPGTKLAEMQKEIVIATWKLRQEKFSTAKTKIPHENSF